MHARRARHEPRSSGRQSAHYWPAGKVRADSRRLLRGSRSQRTRTSESGPPLLYLIRHGETEWSLSGQHTGRTDLPLIERGAGNARRLGERLRGIHLARVWTSPLQRARQTCELAGFGSMAEIDPDLREWDYGQYEGMRSVEIHQSQPGWQLFRDGAPGGETPGEVSTRADRVVERLRSLAGNVAVFSHGHLLRSLAVRWIGLPILEAQHFLLHTGSVSLLSFEHEDPARPAIALWNDTRHCAG